MHYISDNNATDIRYQSQQYMEEIAAVFSFNAGSFTFHHSGRERFTSRSIHTNHELGFTNIAMVFMLHIVMYYTTM